MTTRIDTGPGPEEHCVHHTLAAIVDRALWRGAGVAPDERAKVLAFEREQGDPHFLQRRSNDILVGWIAVFIAAIFVMAIPAAVAASAYRTALPFIGALTFAIGMFCTTGAAATVRWQWAAREASRLYAAGREHDPAYAAAVRKATPSGSTVPVQVVIGLVSGALFLLG